MKFITRRAGYSLLDRRRNVDILELKVDTVRKKLAEYKQKLLNHISRTEDIRYPNNTLTIDLTEDEDLDDL